MGTTRVVSECHPVPAVWSSLKHVMCWFCSVCPKYNVTIPTATSYHLLGLFWPLCWVPTRRGFSAHARPQHLARSTASGDIELEDIFTSAAKHLCTVSIAGPCAHMHEPSAALLELASARPPLLDHHVAVTEARPWHINGLLACTGP